MGEREAALKASLPLAVIALAVAGAAGYFLGERSAAPPAPVQAPPPDAAAEREAAKRAAVTPVPAATSPPASNPRPALASPPLPPLNTPVALLLDDLKKQAAAGNIQAACRVSFELERCHNIPRMQRGASGFANLAGQPGMTPELVKRYNAIAEREQARAHEVQRLCQGVSKEESQEAWRFLLQAARAGHGPSMARFASRRVLWDEDPMRVLDGLIAFRAEGPGFLQAAVQMGHPEAYEQLAFAQVNGITMGLDIPVDRIRGLAHYFALMRTGTPDEVARLQRIVDYAVNKEKLTPEDIAKARVLAEPLAANLLRHNPPGSVDFSAGTFANDTGGHCEK